MDGLQQYLLELSDRLDDEGQEKCADAVDELIKTASLQKLAQYVGVIGYVLKQNRAMGNCIRKKRAASKASMQEVVLQCLKEYQDSQEYFDTEWTQKYAQIIKEEPEKFNAAHLAFLAALGEASQMDEHLNKVHKTAELLQEHGIDEPVFNTILAHLGTFGTLLDKDAASHRPFKVAAPPSQRSWWSRFWNPSSYSWWNPRSWDRSNRERGQDEETVIKMEKIVAELSGITRETQKVRTTIARLKSEAAGYTAGSFENLGPKNRVPLPPAGQPPYGKKENVGNIDIIVPYIQKLNPDDWNQSVLTTQQLQWLLHKKLVVNEYNKEIVERATQLIQRLFDGMNQVYQHISNVQDMMDDLRTDPAVMGREKALQPGGEKNPWALNSPAEEYADFQNVLERLYQNPFDSKAQWYAQKLHGRLWDKLRYIERPMEEGYQSWMSKDPPLPGQQLPSDSAPGQTAPAPYNKEDLQHLGRELGTAMDSKKLMDLVSKITAMFVKSEDPEVREVAQRFQALVSSSIEELGSVEAPISEPTIETTPEIGSQTDEAAYIQEIAADENMEDMPETEIRSILDGLKNEKPEDAARIARLPNSEAKRQEFMQLFSEDVRRIINQRVRRTGTRPDLRPSEMPHTAKLSVFDIVKLADIIDKYDPQIAGFLDEVIERYDELSKERTKFPEFGVPIKEEGILARNSTI